MIEKTYLDALNDIVKLKLDDYKKLPDSEKLKSRYTIKIGGKGKFDKDANGEIGFTEAIYGFFQLKKGDLPDSTPKDYTLQELFTDYLINCGELSTNSRFKVEDIDFFGNDIDPGEPR